MRTRCNVELNVVKCISLTEGGKGKPAETCLDNDLTAPGKAIFTRCPSGMQPHRLFWDPCQRAALPTHSPALHQVHPLSHIRKQSQQQLQQLPQQPLCTLSQPLNCSLVQHPQGYSQLPPRSQPDQLPDPLPPVCTAPLMCTLPALNLLQSRRSTPLPRLCPAPPSRMRPSPALGRMASLPQVLSLPSLFGPNTLSGVSTSAPCCHPWS